jgi:hypothetical protein
MELNKVSYIRRSSAVGSSEDKYRVKETNFQTIFEYSEGVSSILINPHSTQHPVIFPDFQQTSPYNHKANPTKIKAAKVCPILSKDKSFSNSKSLASTIQSPKNAVWYSGPKDEVDDTILRREMVQSRSLKSFETVSSLKLPSISPISNNDVKAVNQEKLPDIHSPNKDKRLHSLVIKNPRSLSLKKEIPLYGAAFKKFAISKYDILSMNYINSIKNCKEDDRDPPIDFTIKRW